MSSTNDTPMTRFLFAILKQKDLKDIDWNQVAHDPILTQEISNGHAARMRYSRFRSAMLGLEPQRRKTPAASKSKVTKPKKDAKRKKEEASDSDTCVKGELIKAERMKQDPGAELDSLHMVPTVPSPKVKQERAQPLNTALPDSSATAGHTHFHNRLMTPCSDADPMHVNDLLESTYDYSGASACGHDAFTPWSHNASPYQPFGMGYAMGYDDFCGHMPDDMLEQNPEETVKHEDWRMHEY